MGRRRGRTSGGAVMARARLHGARNGETIDGILFDTRSDPDWVIGSVDGHPVARQSKWSGGLVYEQGHNHRGREVYVLEVMRKNAWQSYDACAAEFAVLRRRGW